MSDPQTQQQQSQAVATTAPQRAPVFVGMRGLEIKSLDDLWRVSGYIAKSGLAPKGIETPEAIFVALELGLELGLPLMSALQNIAVINGRPGVYGDIQLALVRASGLLEDYSEQEVGTKGTDSWGYKAICKRVNGKFANRTFTVEDAKRAQLWGKAGPWTNYPQRMLMFRARGWLLRDEFGDVLKGVKSVEELRDLTEEEKFERARNIHPLAPPDPRAAAAQDHTVDERAADEKAQADAGLAPAQTEMVTPKAETKSPERDTKQANTETKPAKAEKTPQDALAEVLLASGITFDQFAKFAKASNWDGNWDNIDSFSAIPRELAEMWSKSSKFVVKSILVWKKEQGL